MYDPFEPRREPARSIYLAFQAEAEKRRGRSVAEWTTAECKAVHTEATFQARRLGLRAPTTDEVADAERSARGHIDYGLKWALRVTEVMRSGSNGLVKNRRGCEA